MKRARPGDGGGSSSSSSSASSSSSSSSSSGGSSSSSDAAPPYTVTVRREHTATPVVEMYGDADLGHAYDANRLLALFSAQHVEDATLDLWRNTLNYRIFENKAEALRRLQLVATYSETNASAGPGIKNKLRMLTKILTDPARTLDPVQLLLTLASHGGVCNIMKEVGIHTAYSLATDTVRDRFECATLDQQVLRALRDLREMLVEEEYKQKAIGRNNAHPLTEYRNYLYTIQCSDIFTLINEKLHTEA